MRKTIIALIAGLTISLGASACDIEFNVTLETFGEGVLVELRAGSPGTSRVIQSFRSRGGSVNFHSLCAGNYFLAIGNEESVSVTPVRYFEFGHIYNSRIVLQRGSGNVSTRPRKSL